MIDLRSDTVTCPSPGMRAAMASAEVGDDVFGEDPTVDILQRRIAELLGKERALFVPSGTMANQVAIRVLTQPGDEVVLGADAHPFHYEAGGAAVISGVTLRLVPAERGVLDPDVVRAAVRAPNVHHAPATLLSVENTSNRGGGAVTDLERTHALLDVARAADMHTHLDGARLWNAAAACGASVADLAAGFDVVNVCFSKGLGAPVGSCWAGPAALYERARRCRKMLGGGMRQVGVLAAACLYALDRNLPRIGDDHARARRLWEILSGLGYAVEAAPETNILFFRVDDAPAWVARAEAAGVRTVALAADRVRMVTHLEITDEDVEGVGERLRPMPTG